MRKKKNEKNNDKLEVQEELGFNENTLKETETDSDGNDLDIEELKKSIMNDLSSDFSEKADAALKKIDDKMEDFNEKISLIKEDTSTYVMGQLDNDNLNDYMKHRIDKGVSESIEKANKKIIRYKNGIIIKRDIVIVILLVVCFFLGYNLYNVSNIKIDIYRERKTAEGKNSQKKNVRNTEEETESNNEEDNDLKEKKEKYSALVNKYVLKDDSIYIKDFYDGKLSDEMKLYIAFNGLESDKIDLDEDTTSVDNQNLKEEFEKLFDSEYKAKSFKYNNLNFKYLSSKEIYIADGKLSKKKSLIEKEIFGIKEDDNLVVTTVEGKLEDGKLYNILSNSEISNYDGGSLTEYESSLTKVEYTFKNFDGEYKLSSIDVK